eukprot:gene1142-836_t
MVFVGNLTWTTTDEDLVTFLSQQGNVLKAEVQRYEDTKRSKGWGLVEFDENESAVRAVNVLNGQELHGRPVHLRLERSTTYNVEDGSVRVFVGNLAWSVTEAELMSLFQPFEPHGCHIITNMYGRSRGFGIVKFSSETAAQAAIDHFNETILHDRPLEVRFDRGNAEDTYAAALFGTQGEEDGDGDDDDPMASYVYTPPRPRIPFTRDELLTGLRTKQFQKIVVLTGAGISVAAGIPDFRSPGTGLYSRLAELGLPFAEAVFHLQFFRSNPFPFYEVAKWFLTLEGQPTKAHRWIRHLHQQQQLLRNFTQNIDGLELVAGLPEDALIQAHGHMRTAHCIDCHRPYSMASFLEHVQAGQLYRCAPCSAPTSTSSPDESSTPSSTYQGLIKPDIVFFGESLPPSFNANAELMAEADLVIVMGTSLKVFPFAMLVDTMFCPATTPLVLINRENPGILRDR